MAYDDIVLGAAANSKILEIAVRNSATGMLLTGLVFGDVTYSCIREGDDAGAATGACVAATLDSYTDHGWVETSIAGIYQFGVPQASLATGNNAVTIKIAAAGALDVAKRILIMGSDLRAAALAANTTQLAGQTVTASAGVTFPATVGTSTYAGADTAGTTEILTRIPDATAGAAGGLPTVDASNRVAGVIGLTPGNLDVAVSTRAATGADADTLKTLSDQIDLIAGAAGPGATECTLTITNGSGVAIADADVWLTSDAAGTSVVAGTLQTDSNGRATFMLDVGSTYYAWKQKDGVNFTNPESWAV